MLFKDRSGEVECQHMQRKKVREHGLMKEKNENMIDNSLQKMNFIVQLI
jgi:hypothetical protein